MTKVVAGSVLLCVACSGGGPAFGCGDLVAAYAGYAKEIRHWDVWTVDAGYERRRVTKDQASSSPDISPDGSRIAFTSGRSGEWEECCLFFDNRIYLANPDGTDQQELTSGPDDFDPDFSPDGNEIVYTSEPEIKIVPADGGSPRTLHPEGAPDLARDEPAWSPDGERIAFIQNMKGRPATEIWVMDVDGDNARPLLSGKDYGEPNRVEWSPDGDHVAFDASRGGTIVVIVAHVESGEIVEVASGDDPAWVDDETFSYTPHGGDEATPRMELRTLDGKSPELPEGLRDIEYVSDIVDTPLTWTHCD